MNERFRIIPVLLMQEGAAVKTKKFGADRYIGDIVNAAQIFNEKMVDEITIIDIGSHRGAPTSIERISEIAQECFMPMCFGGGVNSLKKAEALFRVGIEKVSINTNFAEGDDLLRHAAKEFGSQSIVASIDVKRINGQAVAFSKGGTQRLTETPLDMAIRAVAEGAGELLIQSIDRDGMRIGYDLPLFDEISAVVDIPVVALGGANDVADLWSILSRGGAAAAGSMFCLYGKHQAVLITYPDLQAYLDSQKHAAQ